MHPRREQLLLATSCRPRYNFGFRLSRGCARFQPGRVAEPKRFAVMPSYRARMLPTVSPVHGGADQSFATHTLEKQNVNFGQISPQPWSPLISDNCTSSQDCLSPTVHVCYLCGSVELSIITFNISDPTLPASSNRDSKNAAVSSNLIWYKSKLPNETH